MKIIILIRMHLKCLLVAAFIFGLVGADDCITPNGETASCISLFDCPLLLKASADATARSFIDKSKCGTGFMVCCGTKSNFTIDKNEKQNTTSQHVNQIKTNETSTGFLPINNSKSSSTLEEKIKLLPSPYTCGRQHSDDYFHTVNYTVFNEFPWVAIIETEPPVIPFGYQRTERVWSQTGSLISRKYVLTIQGFTRIYSAIPLAITGVWLGGYHPLNETECLEDSHVYECNDPPQYFEIEKVIYTNNVTISSHDPIALLRLRGEVTYTDYIRPICLPLPGTRRPNIGETLVESNSEKWEVDSSRSFGNGTKTKYYLKYQDMCDIYNNFANNSEWICLAYSDTNSFTNRGVVGGLLMSSYKARWYQEGIIRYRWSRPDEEGPIGIYMNVSYHINWILDNLEP